MLSEIAIFPLTFFLTILASAQALRLPPLNPYKNNKTVNLRYWYLHIIVLLSLNIYKSFFNKMISLFQKPVGFSYKVPRSLIRVAIPNNKQAL